MREREAMGRQQTLQNIAYTFVRGLLTACLVMGLAPAVAQGDTPLEVKVEKPAQVNKSVPLSSDGDAENEFLKDADSAVKTQEEVRTGADEEQGAFGRINSDVTGGSGAPSSKPSQITTDVTLGTSSDQTETLLVDGLTYLVDHKTESATLTGWYGNAPAGDISVPSQVSDGKVVFRVQIGGGCF